MNYSTDTRLVLHDTETRARLIRHQNGAATSYRGRHSTEVRAEFTPQSGRHQVDDSQTMLISPAQVQSVMAVAPRPQVAEVVAVVVPEPVAPVTVNLLERILRRLRRAL